MKDAVSRKRDAHKAMCQDNTEENKRRCTSVKSRAKKAVSKTMSEKAEAALTELRKLPKWDVLISKWIEDL